MAYQLSEINAGHAARTSQGFLEECDAEFQQQGGPGGGQASWRIWLKAPSFCSPAPPARGKTTTAMKIDEALERRGVRHPHHLHGQLFQDRLSGDDTPHARRAAMTSSPRLCMDMELLNEHFTALARGEEVLMPHYDFCRQMRRHQPERAAAAEEKRGRRLRGHPRPQRRHRRSAIPRRTKLYISARSNITDGEAVIIQGHLDASGAPGRPGHELFRGSDVVGDAGRNGPMCAGAKSSTSRPFKHRADISISDSSSPLRSLRCMKQLCASGFSRRCRPRIPARRRTAGASSTPLRRCEDVIDRRFWWPRNL